MAKIHRIFEFVKGVAFYCLLLTKDGVKFSATNFQNEPTSAM